jgi:hypothetical protein
LPTRALLDGGEQRALVTPSSFDATRRDVADREGAAASATQPSFTTPMSTTGRRRARA